MNRNLDRPGRIEHARGHDRSMLGENEWRIPPPAPT
jgi:hypothetical protein